MNTHPIVIAVGAILVVEVVVFMMLFAPINAAFKRIKKISEWTEIILSVYVTAYTLIIITLISPRYPSSIVPGEFNSVTACFNANPLRGRT